MNVKLISFILFTHLYYYTLCSQRIFIIKVSIIFLTSELDVSNNIVITKLHIFGLNDVTF